MKTLPTIMAAFILMQPLIAYANVPVITGGVGEEDAARLEEVQKNFDLKVTFADKTGEYLSDVAYSIARTNGEVMAQGKTTGPILLTQLPEGTYRLNADFNGQHKSQDVTIGKNGLRSLTITFIAS